MGVEIIYCDGEVLNWKEEEEVVRGWGVIAKQLEEDGDDACLLGPIFGTERDARIGLAALQNACGFDLNIRNPEFDIRWKEFGGWKQARKVMCEALQW